MALPGSRPSAAALRCRRTAPWPATRRSPPTSSSAAPATSRTAITTGLGSIEDPDLLTPVGSPHAAEDAGPLAFDFTICRRAGRGTDSRPVFASSGGTATAGEDYTELPAKEIVVPGVETRVSVPVELLDDDASEPWESLSVSAAADGNVVQTRPARGFIADDDLPAQGRSTSSRTARSSRSTAMRRIRGRS